MSYEALLTKHRAEIERMEDSGEMSDALYQDFYDYFVNSGEMPYGTAKARDGDPYEWIFYRLTETMH